MNNLFELLFALSFYGLMWYLYSYSNGKHKVKEEKKERYVLWVEKNGVKVSKGIRTLTILFTALFILKLFGFA